MLVVTLREGVERGICSAVLTELVKIIKDEVEERSVVVLVLNEEIRIPEILSVKALLRGDHVKCVDVEGMRVVTNNRCVSEQIKSDKKWRTSRRVESKLQTLENVGKKARIQRTS